VFAGSPRLSLTAGHWCPECVTDSAEYERQAERTPFLAQLEGRLSQYCNEQSGVRRW
jgi:hypothetical protein